MPDDSSPPATACAWRLHGAKDQGARDYQEDAFQTWSGKGNSGVFVVVADGAGGHGGGAEASAAAVAEAGRLVADPARPADPGRFLEEWMLGAHEAVRKTGKGGARTAVVAMLAKGGRVDWVHAGDCRLYHFRAGERLSRTRDDSVVQVLFEQGEIEEREMGRHEDQNRLLQAVGGEEPPKPRRGSAEALPGDVFLLCSDGFWENLEPEELSRLTRVPPHRLGRALNRALRTAVERGGSKADNASAVLAVYGDNAHGGPGPLGWRRILPWMLVGLAVLAAAVLALKAPPPSLARWLERILGGGVEAVGETVETVEDVAGETAGGVAGAAAAGPDSATTSDEASAEPRGSAPDEQ